MIEPTGKFSSRGPLPDQVSTSSIAEEPAGSSDGFLVGASFPGDTATEIMVHGRPDRRRHIERRDQRQKRRPKRRSAEAAERGEIAGRKRHPRDQPAPECGASSEQRQEQAATARSRPCRTSSGRATKGNSEAGRRRFVRPSARCRRSTDRAEPSVPRRHGRARFCRPFFTAAANATSSINAPLTLSMPPIRRKARRLIRIDPPAAAAVVLSPSLTHSNG